MNLMPMVAIGAFISLHFSWIYPTDPDDCFRYEKDYKALKYIMWIYVNITMKMVRLWIHLMFFDRLNVECERISRTNDDFKAFNPCKLSRIATNLIRTIFDIWFWNFNYEYFIRNSSRFRHLLNSQLDLSVRWWG
jgi:hypothetical protein